MRQLLNREFFKEYKVENILENINSDERSVEICTQLIPNQTMVVTNSINQIFNGDLGHTLIFSKHKDFAVAFNKNTNMQLPVLVPNSTRLSSFRSAIIPLEYVTPQNFTNVLNREREATYHSYNVHVYKGWLAVFSSFCTRQEDQTRLRSEIEEYIENLDMDFSYNCLKCGEKHQYQPTINHYHGLCDSCFSTVVTRRRLVHG